MSTGKPKLFISSLVINFLKISPEYLDSLRGKFDVSTANKEQTSKEEILTLVKGAHAIIAYVHDLMGEDLIKAAGENLKVLSIPSAGYDNLKTDCLKACSVRVGLAGNAITNCTAELAMTLLLAASRKLVPISDTYKKDPLGYYRAPRKEVQITGLENTVVGIVGAGRIGQSVAKKVKSFAISRLLYYSRSKKNEMKTLDAQLCTLEKLIEESDYIVLSIALNENTNKIINKRILSLMKPTAIIVNVGRGALIDQDALIDVLKSRKIGGAALDVTTPEPLPSADHPLLQLDNALIFPHLGGLSTSTQKNVIDLAMKNVIAGLGNAEMPEELKL